MSEAAAVESLATRCATKKYHHHHHLQPKEMESGPEIRSVVIREGAKMMAVGGLLVL